MKKSKVVPLFPLSPPPRAQLVKELRAFLPELDDAGVQVLHGVLFGMIGRMRPGKIRTFPKHMRDMIAGLKKVDFKPEEKKIGEVVKSLEKKVRAAS